MKIKVLREDGEFDVLLLPHKMSDKYSFVNITKGHICPCVFDSIEEALNDLNDYIDRGLILNYEITQHNDNKLF